MSTLTVLHLHRQTGINAVLEQARSQAPFVAVDPKGHRRSKIWDISSHFHCSIIGTCLSAAELRQFFVRLGEADAKGATDHVLHGRGVRTAGQHDLAGKLLHKTLDKRHETAIKRFTRASTVAEVRDLWLQALDQGDIPGAYWAVLTHPAADRPLIQEVFGEVHMLSHMVGTSNRVDIARLRKLERDLGARDEKIARQEARLQTAANERSELLRRIESLEIEAARRTVQDQAKAGPQLAPAAMAALAQRSDAEKAHAQVLAARLKEVEDQAAIERKRNAELIEREAHLQRELSALEASLHLGGPNQDGPKAAARDLADLTLLYVGGRPKLLDQLKALAAGRGGVLLAHDGGIEDSAALLPGLISQADAAFFPVDCISHHAAGQVKKLCRDAGKPFVPLRTASLASFIAAIAGGDLPARPAAVA
ncbi:DUF2325 domain-containing protein [Phreatobacter stygius]|uniref:DUF2325 domain-containing protein n=1 Tax=Phreatobacter stygius TaxID=1940610 RepID=A0A4D7BD10_9HYPH|nr:DUF2325 domain-containing protein [Phreatobacter stygius]QCI68730.1 DUF2325 domain-containing protein [Phreatobacter stygius]